MAKETYSYGQRDLFVWPKRTLRMAKETYPYGQRDLFRWPKRPIHMLKDTYSYGQRDLVIADCWRYQVHLTYVAALAYNLGHLAYARYRWQFGWRRADLWMVLSLL